LASLRELCSGAAAARVPLLLDAEQSHRQPAIRLIARTLSAQFNRTPLPIVYDTHQAYLRGAESVLSQELRHARAGGYTLAVKLVRGAYLTAERARDAERDDASSEVSSVASEQDGGAGVGESGGQRPQPRRGATVHESKEETDGSYDRCATMLLAAATTGVPGAGAGADLTNPAAGALLLATHNRASARAVAEQMQKSGTALDHPRVHFAQILGMADDLTFSLGLGGYNALKLVPFGAFEEVLPWMLRRLEENQSALGAAAIERPLLRAEVGRRMFSWR